MPLVELGIPRNTAPQGEPDDLDGSFMSAGSLHSPQPPQPKKVKPEILDPTVVYKEGKFTLLQACSLNTLNMFGTGPFITIPFLFAATSPPGPQAMIGYAVAALACILDSFVWAELGAMFPQSGGTYIYLRELYGRDKWGRLMAFLFVWQFFLSGPMETASGFIAIGQYLSYITGDTSFWHHSLIAFGFCLVSLFSLYRNIDDVGKTTVVLWAGTVAAIAFTIVTGFWNLDLNNYKMPSDWFDNKAAFVMSLGAAARFGIYDFTGYFDINHIGTEVKNPRRTIPIACILTCCVVAVLYFAVDLAVLGYLPWDPKEGGFVALVESGTGSANYIMSIYCEKLVNKSFAYFFTCVCVFTIFGSCFALLLGYAAIPFAAAKDGYFYEWLAHEHETKEGLADYALLLTGGMTLIFCFVDLQIVIEGMLTTRLLIQFIGQSLGLILYRRTHPETPRYFKVPLYPWSCIVQAVLFFFCFITVPNYLISGDTPLLELGVAFILAGLIAYVMYAKHRSYWPFEEEEATAAAEPTREEAPAKGRRQDQGTRAAVSPNVARRRTPARRERIA